MSGACHAPGVSLHGTKSWIQIVQAEIWETSSPSCNDLLLLLRKQSGHLCGYSACGQLQSSCAQLVALPQAVSQRVGAEASLFHVSGPPRTSSHQGSW